MGTVDLIGSVEDKDVIYWSEDILVKKQIIEQQLNELSYDETVALAKAEIKKYTKELLDAIADSSGTQTLLALAELNYTLFLVAELANVTPYIDEAFYAVHESRLTNVSDEGLPVYDKRGGFKMTNNFQPVDIIAVINSVDAQQGE